MLLRNKKEIDFETCSVRNAIQKHAGRMKTDHPSLTMLFHLYRFLEEAKLIYRDWKSNQRMLGGVLSRILFIFSLFKLVLLRIAYNMFQPQPTTRTTLTSYLQLSIVTRHHRLVDKISTVRKGFLPLDVAQWAPIDTQTLLLFFVTSQNLTIRPCCWSHRTKRNQAGPNLEVSSLPYWLAFMVFEGAIHATRGENHHHLICDPWGL